MNRKFNKKNENLRFNIICMICIFISTCFLAIGYAETNSVNLNIGVGLNAPEYVGMFISDVNYLNSVGADTTNSKIVDYTGTMLHSNIYLSTVSSDSSIIYEVTIVNNSDATKKFTGITYSQEFYSNQYIEYKLNGLEVNDIIIKGESKTFELTFYYNSANINNNNLDSYLNFNFDYYFEEENDVDIVLNDGESYSFAGVSADTPIDLPNIANINFKVLNGSEKFIKGVNVDVVYTTSTGSKQSAVINLQDEEGATLSTQTVEFRGKQTNATQTIQFSNLNVENGKRLSISFAQGTTTNGQVKISGVIITPVF